MEAFQQMFVAYRPKFVAMAHSILRNREDAEDAVQNAFLSGHSHLRSFEGRSALMFRTGDIGYRDSDGYFYILDRLKDMIVTGGENVYSGEVEAVIYKHPAVRDADWNLSPKCTSLHTRVSARVERSANCLSFAVQLRELHLQ
jgi:acyl-CoA synthetase (AMP-forming)/AMP-acid ligase II